MRPKKIYITHGGLIRCGACSAREKKSIYLNPSEFSDVMLKIAYTAHLHGKKGTNKIFCKSCISQFKKREVKKKDITEIKTCKDCGLEFNKSEMAINTSTGKYYARCMGCHKIHKKKINDVYRKNCHEPKQTTEKCTDLYSEFFTLIPKIRPDKIWQGPIAKHSIDVKQTFSKSWI